MLKSLRAVARFFQKNIGWNRIGVLLSLAIIAVAAVVLFHMLRDIDVDEVIAAMKAIEYRDVALAASVRRRRLFHAHVLRPVRAAHDRPQRDSVSDRRARPASPAIRSATMSAPPCSPAARCATASIRPTVSTRSRSPRSASSPASPSGSATPPCWASASSIEPQAAMRDRSAAGLAQPRASRSLMLARARRPMSPGSGARRA